MSSLKVHPYTQFIHRVQKPSRYLGGEHGEAQKDWDSVDCRICLAFPDLYEIGMSHLGFKILYSIVNGHPKLLAERCYTPWFDMEGELRARNEPLRSLETWRPLSEFDVVGFSLQFELTFTNVLLMLDLGAIPRRTSDRKEEDPLVLAGGPTATHAEPMAPFIDAFVIGDGEEKTPEVMLTWTAMRRAGVARAARLRHLASLGGVYVPSLYETSADPDTGFQVVVPPAAVEGQAGPADAPPFPIRRAFLPTFERHSFPSGGPVASTETVFDRVSVEIARGCTEGCRFCQAGMIYRPVRERDPQDILNVIEHAIREGGYDEVSLTSLSTADYSAIAPLVREVMKRMEKEKVSLSVSSLRAYGLGEELLDEIQKVRATGLTFAPEAGSQRMRDVVNKNVTEEQLMETAERVFSRGWAKMKLYFMIGLPTEEEDDVRGIVQTGARAQQVGRRVQRSKLPRVTVSVSTHVPKPHTPFQWCAMDARQDVLRKQSILKDEARKQGVRLRMHDSQASWLEGILARGDRSLADVIEGAYERGARFDSWEERLQLTAWSEAFDAHGVDPNRFLGTIPLTARLPWDHIDVGLADGFLAREYKKAVRNRLSPPCGKAVGMFIHHTNQKQAEQDQRKLVCYHCGVACDMTEMREQRVQFLGKLGAVEPLERKLLPVVSPDDGPGRLVRHVGVLAGTPTSPQGGPNGSTQPISGFKHQRRPTAKFSQGTPVRVRLKYQKLGRAAYQSHLDLVRLLPRFFRRVGLQLYYSEGFHPKPEMTFGPALSVGIASLTEYMDIKVCEGVEIDLPSLPRRLSDVAQEGIAFLDAKLLGPNDASLNKVIDTASYVAGIPRTELSGQGISGTADLRSRVAERMSSPMKVRRVIEGLGKTVDVAAYLLGLDVDAEGEALTAAGLVGDLLPLRMDLRITGGGTAKPSEVLEAVFGTGELEARFVRTGLWFSGTARARLSPMDLESLRVRSVTKPSVSEASIEHRVDPVVTGGP